VLPDIVGTSLDKGAEIDAPAEKVSAIAAAAPTIPKVSGNLDRGRDRVFARLFIPHKRPEVGVKCYLLWRIAIPAQFLQPLPIFRRGLGCVRSCR
jgi:hypothetical protein